MSLKEWMAQFKAAHEKARSGALVGEELASYRAGRDELARALLGAQSATMRPGEKPRQVLRVARALQADLEWSVDRVRAVTQDLSSGGFSALLARTPPTDEEVKVQLRIPGGDPLVTAARVVGAQPQVAAMRVSFAFSGIAPTDRDRVEFLVFDTVIQQIKV